MTVPLLGQHDWYRAPTGLIIPASAVPPARPPIGIDLFAGGGGFSLGMHQGGFQVIAALEFGFDAAITYMVNLASPGVQLHYDTIEREEQFVRHLEEHMGMRPKKGRKKKQVFGSAGPIYGELTKAGLTAGSGWLSHYGCLNDKGCNHEGIGYDGEYHEYLAGINKRPEHPYGCEHFWVADARNIKGAEILEAIGREVGEVDVVFGGPPCQGFSSASGKKRDDQVEDPRNSLVFEFIRLVLEIQPKCMVMENVPRMVQMLTPDGTPVVDLICRMLEDGGMGTYDTLRRSLVASAGLQPGAVLRGRGRLKHAPEEVGEDEELEVDLRSTGVQESLFA
jgi:DNA (cytosine-5)-methyltransferase 1